MERSRPWPAAHNSLPCPHFVTGSYRANKNMQLQKERSLPSWWCMPCQQHHIYKANVTSASARTRFYIGMSAHSFKTRNNNHKLSHDTVLSKYCISGTWKTMTLISRSSGLLSCKQVCTMEPNHTAICVWQKNSAFYPQTNPRF